MIIYISGPITGIPNYRNAFEKAQKQLEKEGMIVLNPAVLPGEMPFDKYMPICLAMINQADMIYLLPGWENSQGCKFELEYAKYQGKVIKLSYCEKGEIL